MTTQRDYSFKEAFSERKDEFAVVISMLTLLQSQVRNEGEDDKAEAITPHIAFLVNLLSQSIGENAAEELVGEKIYQYANWVGKTLSDLDRIDPVSEAEEILRKARGE